MGALTSGWTPLSVLKAALAVSMLVCLVAPAVVSAGKVNPYEEAPEKPKLPEVEESLAGFGLLMLVMVLVIVFVVGYLLKNAHFHYLHESGAAMLIGLVTGILIRYGTNAETLRGVVAFDQHFFFLVLLPPIIFESGYNMKRGHFFYNFDSILWFALLGTMVSMILTGLLVYLFSGVIGMTAVKLELIDCMFIGAILSATDPVTVLSLFKELGVTPNLYANVFGESVLNDAVAIVLYKLVENFVHNPFTAGSLLLSLLNVLKILIGSVVIAAITGGGAALLFKHTDLHKYPQMESALLILHAYISYLAADDFGFSGIVAILFAGIILNQYAYYNLSKVSQRITRRFFEIVPLVFETFVFIYLGMILFTFDQEFDIALCVITFIILLLTRAAHIFPLSFIVNIFRGEDHKIPRNEQIMMWFSGLRGAIAVALSLNVPSYNSKIILSNTLIIVFLTVIVFGGMTVPMLNYLKIPIGLTDVKDLEDNEVDFLKQNKWMRWNREFFKPFLIANYNASNRPGEASESAGHKNGAQSPKETRAAAPQVSVAAADAPYDPNAAADYGSYDDPYTSGDYNEQPYGSYDDSQQVELDSVGTGSPPSRATYSV
eukprot:TRINITY_DN6250_c0_g1_i1.p1 TRINITY_DN6250_c0_g1~~TRINITY_DN6250_c0_g1_i1.p1  ORF type:complete len:603 (-),score=192.92 TRINITY_DN6250_c0_g1_i1:84-1892(-)